MKYLPSSLQCLGAALLIGSLVGCSPSPPPPSSAAPPEALTSTQDALRAAVLTQGSDIVSQAGKALSGVLLEAIQQGGPTNALSLCSVQAIPLTASLAQVNQVGLRRVSHRPRNPSNQANDRELELIQRWSTQVQSGSKPPPEIVTLESGSMAFYAPIVITTNLCLRCHGQPGLDLESEIISVLHQRYPQDQATGFALGDLRGLWRVDFPTQARISP